MRQDRLILFQLYANPGLGSVIGIVNGIIQGITGKKKDFSSLPYSKIQAFSVETAGVLDLDSELELWFSGLGKVKFEFTARSNVSEICRLISERVL